MINSHKGKRHSRSSVLTNICFPIVERNNKIGKVKCWMPKQTELRRGGRSNDGWIVNHLQMLKLPYSCATIMSILQTSNRQGLCSIKIMMNAGLFLYYGGPNPPPPLPLLYCCDIKDQLLAKIQSIWKGRPANLLLDFIPFKWNRHHGPFSKSNRRHISFLLDIMYNKVKL